MAEVPHADGRVRAVDVDDFAFGSAPVKDFPVTTKRSIGKNEAISQNAMPRFSATARR